MIAGTLRLLTWCGLRLDAEYWRLRGRRAHRLSREHYRRALWFRAKAAARDDRADRLYPRPATGPPAHPSPAEGQPAPAQLDGP